ncbi:hypothetical protein BJY01DRAFT_256528 [Aspergillus pseudoustus]|uniref:Clr5 domain-containing protein n=1 Tax=Aspergillus pseudoustus TaxID=1810923 RepID=A0ABR4I8L6_9EURO
MPNPSVFWTDAEVIVAVYFLSRGVTEVAISEMLQARGYHRSISSVRCKTMAIARQNKKLQKSRDEWDIRAVDFWLDSRTLPHGVVSQVIGPTDKDIAIMGEYGLSEVVLENLSCITLFWSELIP